MLKTSVPVALVAEIQRKVGRNLMRFQEIELHIKFMMPYIHPDARANGLDSFKAMREHLLDKPLGAAIEKFKESIETNKPELLAEELSRALDARNQLVHHFLELPGVDFMTPDGVRAAIRYLDEQFQSVQPLYEDVRSQFAAVLLAIQASPGHGMSDLAEHRGTLLDLVGANTEIINVADPRRTVWETTRIVELLRLAERETQPFEGMTLLARAGTLIRQRDPDLSPKAYGLKRLTDVLLTSGLFEVDLRENDESGSVTVLYRSLDPDTHAAASVDRHA